MNTTAEELFALAKEQKELATHILNRGFLKTPAGFESSLARDLVDMLVNAAILEMSAIHRKAMEQ
jgi:hypothetical protein